MESNIKDIIRYYQINTTFEELKESVFNETGQEDFNNIAGLFSSKISDIDELNEVLKIVNAVWNYFPHESLGGLSPIKKLKSAKVNKNRGQNRGRF